eukprot:3849437-Pleurochrysis_carterae.AAC.4
MEGLALRFAEPTGARTRHGTAIFPDLLFPRTERLQTDLALYIVLFRAHSPATVSPLPFRSRDQWAAAATTTATAAATATVVPATTVVATLTNSASDIQ